MRRKTEPELRGSHTTPPYVTLLDLVCAVSESARDELEVVATIHHMLETRSVLLLGEFCEKEIGIAC